METTVHIDRLEITVHAPDKPLFLSLSRAAEESGLSASYLRKLIHRGEFVEGVHYSKPTGRIIFF